MRKYMGKFSMFCFMRNDMGKFSMFCFMRNYMGKFGIFCVKSNYLGKFGIFVLFNEIHLTENSLKYMLLLHLRSASTDLWTSGLVQ